MAGRARKARRLARVLLPLLAAATGAAHGGTLASVSPMGASPSVSVAITGTGFSTTAAENEVTFTSAGGVSIDATASSVTTLSAATGTRRLTVTVPGGLPIGSTALRVRNTATGEISSGKSLEIIEISLPEVNSAAPGDSNVAVRITGSPNTAFVAGRTRATFGAGITVHSTTVESPTNLVANVSVSASAALGPRNVAVVSNTQTAQRVGAFTIATPPPENRPPVWTPVDDPSVSEGETLELALTATDPDGDLLILTAPALPPFASFTDLGNGNARLVLQPGETQAGVYSITLTATDSKGAAASLVFELTVTDTNRPPVADPQALTVAEDEALPVTLTGSDPDGTPVSFSIAAGPAQGTLSGTPPGITYTPAPDYYGPDEFSFIASDGQASSPPATVAIEITEVNDPPVLAADARTLRIAGTLPAIPPRPPCRQPCGVIYGDPHILSFDRAYFDAQAVGEVIAARSTTDDFEVQARFAAVPGYRTVSIAVAVAMRVAGHRVTLYRNPTGYEVRIDGVLAAVPAAPVALPRGGTIGTYGSTDGVVVTWPDGSVASVRAVGIYPEFYRFLVEVGLAPARLDRVVGLLGDADGSDANDIATRGGELLAYPDPPFDTFYGTYINSWRVSMAETLFDYGPGQSTDTFTDLTFPDAPATPQTLPPADLGRATAVCAQFGLSAPEVVEACQVDVGLTGDADFATEAVTALAASLGVAANAGTAEIGAPGTVTIATPGGSAVRTFPGTAGQRLTLTVTGNSIVGADLVVRDPNGSTVATLFVSGEGGFRDTFALPVTGTYTLTVDARDQAAGSLGFLFTEVPGNADEIFIGTPASVTITTAGEVATRTFEGTAGQMLTLTVSGNTIPAADLLVRGPDTFIVASLFVSGANGFRDTFTLPVTGTYTIAVDPRLEATGSLTFVFATVPDNTGVTAIGTPTPISIGTAGEVAVRSFAGTAGQRLTLTVAGNTIPAADISLRSPGNVQVAALFVSGATGFRDTFTLPETGAYTIAVNPREQNIGSLTFTLGVVPDNTGITTIGAPTAISIGTPGEVAVRSFDAAAGQKLTITVAGNSIVAADITVRSPGNVPVASLFVSGATGFRDTFTLPDSGSYTITVDPRDQATGSLTYTLGSVPDNTGATAIGTPTAVTIGTPGEVAVRSFAGTAGQSVTLSVTGNTIPGVDITVRAPGNAFVASLFVSGATGFRSAFALPATGTYTITVDPRDQLTGTLTFTLTEVAP